MALGNGLAIHRTKNINIKQEQITKATGTQKQALEKELTELKANHTKHVEAVQQNLKEQINQAQGEVKKELEKKQAEFKSKYVAEKAQAKEEFKKKKTEFKEEQAQAKEQIEQAQAETINSNSDKGGSGTSGSNDGNQQNGDNQDNTETNIKKDENKSAESDNTINLDEPNGSTTPTNQDKDGKTNTKTKADSTDKTNSNDNKNQNAKKEDNTDSSNKKEVPSLDELNKCKEDFNKYITDVWKSGDNQNHYGKNLDTFKQIQLAIEEKICKGELDELYGNIKTDVDKFYDNNLARNHKPKKDEIQNKIDKLSEKIEEFTNALKNVSEEDTQIIKDLKEISEKPNLYYDNGEWKLCPKSKYSEIIIKKKSLTINAYEPERKYEKGVLKEETKKIKETIKLDKLSDFNVYKYENDKCDIVNFEKVKLYKSDENGTKNLVLCPGIEGTLKNQIWSLNFTADQHDYTQYTFNDIYLDKESVELYNDSECNTLSDA